MKSRSSSAFAVFHLCFAFGLFASVSAISFKSVVDECRKAELAEARKCANGPFCAGYSKPNADDTFDMCVNSDAFESPACPVLYSVKRMKAKEFKVILIGKTGEDGWVALGFEKGGWSDSVPVIVCRSGPKSIATSQLSGQSLVEDAKNAGLISDPAVTLDNKWAICEFKLTAEGAFDVTSKELRTIIAMSNKGGNGRETFRGSSAEAQDFWSNLKVGGGGQGNESGSGPTRSPPPKLLVVVLLVAVALYAVSRL